MKSETIHIKLNQEIKEQVTKLQDNVYSASDVIRAAVKYYYAAKNRNGKFND